VETPEPPGEAWQERAQTVGPQDHRVGGEALAELVSEGRAATPAQLVSEGWAAQPVSEGWAAQPVSEGRAGTLAQAEPEVWAETLAQPV
jgi:hypothetical protein